MKRVFIFGHRNPDTDSVCGAISLSYLKNKLGMHTEPRILDDINNETRYALNYFNVKQPKYLDDVKVRIKDIVYHKDYYINESDSIFNTYHFMDNNNITGIPLVDNSNRFVGYVSLKEIACTMINDSSNYLDTTFDIIVDTLKSKNYGKVSDNISGNIFSATFDDVTFIHNVGLNENSILIVGDRKSIIDYAIECRVKLIIVIGNHNISLEQELNATKNKVNIICTSFNSFETSRLLVLTNKINTIKRNEQCICLDTDDFLTDFLDIANKTKHTNYPIVNKKGICKGLLRLIDINEYEKNKVVLVDHNSLKQSVEGLDEAEILEIVDHHNISDIKTISPINFRNMAVGSVNTIIYYLYKENNIVIPKDIAGLMISGILSDTVLLNSPTTTYNDILVVTELSTMLGINYKEYGLSLLKSGMDNTGQSIEDIIYKDYKTYSTDNYRFSIGQVLTVSFDEYINDIDNYVKVLDEICNKNNYIVTALYITNILTKQSLIIYNNSAHNIMMEAHDLDNIYQGIILEDILSRKKQIVPIIMKTLNKY